MKKHVKFVSFVLIFCIAISCFAVFGCSEKKYSLSVFNSELLYEDLKDSYKEGEEVNVKVKITPNESTVAYLDLTPLVRSKGSQDDFYTFTFTMPAKSASLNIQNKKGFSEDLLTGFYLTFTKDDNEIESLNKDLNSPDAVANYIYTYFDEKYGSDVITSNQGAAVFAEGKQSDKNGFQEIKLEDNLYFTYELLGAVAWVDWVYSKDGTYEVSAIRGVGHQLDDVGYFSTYNTQSLSETRYNDNGEEYEKTFNSEVKINFKYIDYLTGVKVLEYDKSNQLIKSSVIERSENLESFYVTEGCEYAVIEEEYTVMNDEAKKGEKHYDRTLINKATYGGGKVLKYPRGDGLISPVYLGIKW